jgi:hypothetical protein
VGEFLRRLSQAAVVGAVDKKKEGLLYFTGLPSLKGDLESLQGSACPDGRAWAFLFLMFLKSVTVSSLTLGKWGDGGVGEGERGCSRLAPPPPPPLPRLRQEQRPPALKDLSQSTVVGYRLPHKPSP